MNLLLQSLVGKFFLSTLKEYLKCALIVLRLSYMCRDLTKGTLRRENQN